MSRVLDPLLRDLVLLTVVCILNGCTMLGPDHQEPRVEWLDAWQADLYGQVGNPKAQAEVDLRFWWHLFDDPVLNTLIDLAKQENPSLRIAGLRMLESRAALGIAGSARYPQVKQASGAVDYVETDRHGGTLPDSNDHMTTYQAGLAVGWELDFWGRFRRGVESADAAFFASIANRQNVQVLLSAQVADLYFSCRATILQIHIAKENAKVQKQSFEITRLLYEGGEDSELDLQQAKTQYMATLSKIPGLELTLLKTRNALGVLLGRAPGDLPELDEAIRLLPVLDPVIIQDLPAQLLMRRPDVRSAAWQVAAQSAQIGIAKADLYPSITLSGTVGWSGNTQDGSPDTLSLGIGPSFTWNLFDRGHIKNNVRVQDARLQQAIESFQNTVLTAAREIDDAAFGIVKTREQQVPQRESTKAAKRSLEIANVRYREGYADFQRVIDAQRSVASQAEREVTNDKSHISAVISFYKAIGGGWLNDPIEQVVPVTTRETMESRTDWGRLLTTSLPDMPTTSSSPEDARNE